MGVPFTFAGATAALPLAELDTNFATPITLGTTSLVLGTTVTSLAGLTSVSATTFTGGSWTGSTIGLAYGGTGLTGYTAGDLLYASSPTALAKLTIGTSGKVLTSTGSIPQWSDVAGFAVTSFSAGTTGLTPILATSGAITLGGTLNVANGGTGATSLVGYLKGTGTTPFATSATIPTADLSGTISNAQLANSSITINGSSVSLGGSTTVTASSPFALTIGTGLSGTSYNGSAAITVAIDSTVVTLSGTQALTNKTMNSGSIWNGSTIGIGYGGTGQTTANAAFNALVPSQTGNSGKFLTTDGTNTSWSVNPLGTVTSVNGTGTVNGLTLTGTVTSSGSLTLGGTLDLSSPPTIGNTTPNTGAFTTLSASGNVTFSGGTANGVLYLNGSKVATSGSALVFDGTNLGIGVTPSAWTGQNAVLQLKTASIASAGTNELDIGVNFYYNAGNKYYANGYASNYVQYSGQHQWFTAPSGTAGGTISFTQAMTLDASGNLGIGTSSPSFSGSSRRALTLNAPSGQLSILELGINGSLYGYVYANATQTTINAGGGTSATSPLTFEVNSAERMRIDSSGNLLVGTTNTIGKVTIYQNLGSIGDAIDILDTGSSYGSGAVYIKFLNNGGGLAGSIQHNASTTVNYNTSSDARLKTDKGIATDTSVIDNIIIHDFEWNEDGRLDRGVFAQEANEIKPSAVSVGSDETNENGVLINTWGVDYSKFVPDLIVHAQQLKKQVQEQQAIIQSLTARLEALEAK